MTSPAFWRIHQPTEDLTGQTFGLVTVLRKSESHGGGSRWRVKCECGDERTLRRGEIVRGITTHKSCRRAE